MRESAPFQLRMDADDVERAIDAALDRRPRLESHRRIARWVSVVLFLIAALRPLVLFRPGAHLGTVSFIAEVVLLLGAIGAAVHARRVTYQLEKIEQLLLTLRLLKDVFEQQLAPNVFVVEPAEELAVGERRTEGRTAPKIARSVDSGLGTTREIPLARLARTAGLTAAILAAAVLLGARGPDPSTPRVWNFQETSSDPKVLGFRLSSNETGEWLLADCQGATGNRALVNLPGDPAASPASAIVNDSMMRDLKASTRCKAATDRRQQACGLVFRYVDRANYYVARVDTGRGALMVGVVVGAVERELRSATAPVSSAAWQEVAIMAQAEHLFVSLNGQQVLSVVDPTLSTAGRVGMWAPSDGEAYFDELSLSSLPATSALPATFVHPPKLLPILWRRKT